MARIYVEGHGCSASHADTEMIAGIVAAGGHQITRSPEGADLSMLVTCSVKDPTADRMAHRIRELGRGRLVVAGCLPKAEPGAVERLTGSASMMGPGAVAMALEVAESALAGKRRVELGDAGPKVGLPRIRMNRAISIVEIASGCLSECTFCQTKLAKGGLKSYRPGDVAAQVERDVADGCREVWLTSTDNGCYGLDIGADLPGLVRRVAAIPGDFMVRVGMMNPMYLPRMASRLLDAMSSPKVFKFLHVPVQSGSDRVLSEMGRGHTADTFREVAAEARERIGATISTDIIAGFPGETEEDFAETERLLGEVRPDVVNLSRYSKRPGTEAARRDQLDAATIKGRSGRLHGLIRGMTLEANNRWIGWRGRVIADEATDGGIRGRNAEYKPIYITGGAEIGAWSTVEVVGATPNALQAVIAS
ncbi:MAG: tRNA (N(6)-L-threonylcarbamoyladenosine(37)-C(2))-methylthiotransferase [Nitrosopumilus sp.]|nr:tRNA (N(6)-L-threonylcarbamoyladenosine(37)-C(2))-methylthiotransferase [Nitrosopumilus sp.]